MNNHKERKHAILGASSSARWLACTPSAVLSEHIPDTVSEYAQEGTKAHELAESMLKGEYIDSPKYPLEMLEACDEYVRIVTDTYNRYERATMLIECAVRYNEYVPDGFGTVDALIFTHDTIHVFDFKYGQGVKVYASDNSQLSLYTLGAILEIGKLMKHNLFYVEKHIIQPRLSHHDKHVTTVSEVLTWAEDYVQPRALLAHSGEGELVTGDHCRWCKAAPRCPAYGSMMNDLARHEFSKPELLDTTAIEDILPKVDLMQSWLKRVKQYAQDRALEGQEWSGFKLVESSKRKVWSDPQQVAESLKDLGYDESMTHDHKLKSYTNLKKVVGEDLIFLDQWRHQPEGAPVLVPNKDKRDLYNLLTPKEIFK